MNQTCPPSSVTAPASPVPPLTAGMTLLFAVAVGVIIMNLVVPQPLTGVIQEALDLPPAWSGVIAMLPQLGYALGLMLLVPLVDLLENRRLIVGILGCCALLLLGAMLAADKMLFLIAIFLAGATSSAIQMLVPMAAMMSSEAHRGRAIGNVMSGLMVGILLARPLASLITDVAGWRSIYAVLGVAIALLALLLARVLPQRYPPLGNKHDAHSYAGLLKSLWHLLRDEPVLRQRALTAALGLGAFSAFWTSIGLRLAQAPFDLSQKSIALFALAGAAGAVVAPLAGRCADRGWTRPMTVGAHCLMLLACLLALYAGSNVAGVAGIALLAVAAIALDAGVTADQTLGRHAINLLNPAARGRINGLFVAIFFIGGAFGSVAAVAAWAHGGWGGVCAVIAAFCLASLLADVVVRTGKQTRTLPAPQAGAGNHS